MGRRHVPTFCAVERRVEVDVVADWARKPHQNTTFHGRKVGGSKLSDGIDPCLPTGLEQRQTVGASSNGERAEGSKSCSPTRTPTRSRPSVEYTPKATTTGFPWPPGPRPVRRTSSSRMFWRKTRADRRSATSKSRPPTRRPSRSSRPEVAASIVTASCWSPFKTSARPPRRDSRIRVARPRGRANSAARGGGGRRWP